MFWCPYMVSVQCNGGLPPDIILLTLCDFIGEPFQYHVEFLSLQPLFPPKPFDSLEGLDVFGFFFKQERCKDEKLQSKYACADEPSAPGCRTDGAINRCMGSVSATSGLDTELQVPDEIVQKIGMKTSFSKNVPKLSNNVFFIITTHAWNNGRDIFPRRTIRDLNITKQITTIGTTSFYSCCRGAAFKQIRLIPPPLPESNTRWRITRAMRVFSGAIIPFLNEHSHVNNDT